jgi:hypothetical protein
MDENKIIAALLTIACNASAHKASGADPDRVMNEYDGFLQRLEKKESESVPEPQKNLASLFKSRSKKDE